MPARGLVRPGFRRQNFATIIGAEKKQRSFIERRHRDHFDRNAFWRGRIFNE